MTGHAIQVEGMDHPREVTRVTECGYLPMVEVDGMELYLAEDDETAGAAARKYWKDMATDDPKEFACLVGDETLIAWARGQSASPGSVSCSSLEEWLDLCATVPNEEFASYDGEERSVIRVSPSLCADLGFTPTIAYRHN